MQRSSIFFFLVICLLGALGLAPHSHAQAPGAYFTAAQAEQGSSVYGQTCAMCHGQNLEGTADAPALSGKTFQSQWQSRMGLELFGEISESMPPTKPGSLTETAAALAVTAYILQRNGAITGSQELRGGSTAKISEILSAAPLAAGNGAVEGVPDKVGGRYGRNGPREILTIQDSRTARPAMDAAAQARFAEMSKPLDKLTLVTDTMLRDPSPNDWLPDSSNLLR